MNETIVTLKKTARLAGLLYFLLAVAGIYDIMYVSPKIIVAGDITATGKNMLANEFLYRTSIASAVVINILFVRLVEQRI